MKAVLIALMILGSSNAVAVDESFVRSNLPENVKFVIDDSSDYKARVRKLKNGGVIEMNSKFMQSLSEKAALFAIKHELAHLEHNHFAKMATHKQYELELEADRYAIEALKDDACEAVKEIAYTRDYGVFSLFAAKTHPDSKELIKNACGE